MFRPTFFRFAVFAVLPTFIRFAVFTEFPTFVAVFTALQTFVTVTVAVLTDTDAGRPDTYFVRSCRSRPDYKTQRRTQQYNLHHALLGMPTLNRVPRHSVPSQKEVDRRRKVPR
jgi:hypothetical protein